MKRSIKRLPKRTQEELNVLLELIVQNIKSCKMIILYGSYARGGYVLWDEKIENRVRTSYQSDYDILVVIEGGSTTYLESLLRKRVFTKYEKIFEHRRCAPPQFIVETVDKVNKELIKSQYFFTDIIKEGIKIYDTNEFKLEKAKQLSYKEIKEIAEGEFNVTYPRANEFLVMGCLAYELNYYVNGSFQLHQACERYYKTITLVFKNYRPKTHELIKLAVMTKVYSTELLTLFPINTDFEKRCYNLLCDAYIDARYNPDFVVTKNEYEYMLKRTKILKEITERICTEKIKSYDLFIEQE